MSHAIINKSNYDIVLKPCYNNNHAILICNWFLTILKTAITSMRAVVVMVRTNRSQGLLVTMMREEVGNQVREQREPFLPC